MLIATRQYRGIEEFLITNELEAICVQKYRGMLRAQFGIFSVWNNC